MQGGLPLQAVPPSPRRDLYRIEFPVLPRAGVYYDCHFSDFPSATGRACLFPTGKSAYVCIPHSLCSAHASRVRSAVQVFHHIQSNYETLFAQAKRNVQRKRSTHSVLEIVCLRPRHYSLSCPLSEYSAGCFNRFFFRKNVNLRITSARNKIAQNSSVFRRAFTRTIILLTIF